MSKKTLLSAAAILVLTALVATPASAQLGGHNFRGDAGLSAGSQPPPGWYFTLIYLSYDTDTLRDRNGDRLTLDPEEPGRVLAKAISPIVMWVSEKKVLGGSYAFVLAPAFANTRIGLPALSLIDDSGTDFTDLYIQPINLGWHKDRADFSAGVGIYAPTGSFEFGADDNVGLGMWTFELFGGTTVFLDRAKSWNLTAVASWETHGEKEGSDQQVGDIVTLEGGLGKSFAEGAVNVGVAYFGQWKVSSDDFGSELTSDLAALLELDDHRVFGAGPEISFPIVAKQRLIAAVSARYLFDFGSRSTTEGDTLYVGFTFPFGGSGS